ncbi:MAG: hypothetical protein J3R72DRAFT_399686, partial [Linnemannia gamsii]
FILSALHLCGPFDSLQQSHPTLPFSTTFISSSFLLSFLFLFISPSSSSPPFTFLPYFLQPHPLILSFFPLNISSTYVSHFFDPLFLVCYSSEEGVVFIIVSSIFTQSVCLPLALTDQLTLH